MATAGEKKALKQRVVSTLESGAAAYIEFSFDGIRINQVDFLRVAQAVRKDKVHIAVGRMPPEVEAQYSNRSNTLKFPRWSYGKTVAEEAAIIHEAAHCILDMKKIIVSALKNEIIAYICSGTYRYIKGFEPVSGTGKLLGEIARQIIAEDKTVLLTYMPEVSILATAIINTDTYRYLYFHEDYDYGQDGVKGT